MKPMAVVLACLLLVSCSSGLSVEAQQGEALVADLGCTSCHSGGIGPDWVGEWGTTRTFADGSKAAFDEDYARRAITDPGVEVLEGYDPVMPPYSLNEKEITAIVAYLRAVR